MIDTVAILALGWVLTVVVGVVLVAAAVRHVAVRLFVEALWLAAWGFVAVAIPFWSGAWIVGSAMLAPFAIYLALRTRLM